MERIERSKAAFFVQTGRRPPALHDFRPTAVLLVASTSGGPAL